MRNIRQITPNCFELRKNWPQKRGEFRRQFPTFREAKALLEEINVSIRNGSWPDVRNRLCRGPAADHTVATYWPIFRDRYCTVRVKSWRRYEISFRSLIDRLGDVRLKDLRRSHVYEYMEWRKMQPNGRTPGVEITGATVNRDIYALKSMITFALDQGEIDLDPLAKLRSYKEPRKLIRIPTEMELNSFLACCRKERKSIYLFALIMAETGLRRSEALNIRRSQFDLRNRTIGVIGKGDKLRYVPLTDNIISILSSMPISITDEKILINERTGKPWSNPMPVWRRASRNAGIPWLNIHALRHYRVTEWVAAGIDLRTVQEWAGHSSLAVTQRYAHVKQGVSGAIGTNGVKSELA